MEISLVDPGSNFAIIIVGRLFLWLSLVSNIPGPGGIDVWFYLRAVFLSSQSSLLIHPDRCGSCNLPCRLPTLEFRSYGRRRIRFYDAKELAALNFQEIE
jgi:hypothetical protein